MARHVLAVLLTLGLTSTADAQFGFGSGSQRIQRPFDRPTVSPYINLLRNDGAGLNYYGLVRPGQQFGASIQQLQMGLGGGRGMGQRSGFLVGGRLRSGHVVVFDSYRTGAVGFGAGGFGGGGSGGGRFGGGGGFSPGFLNPSSSGGGFGGPGGGGNSSFSPISGGALNGGQAAANVGGGGMQSAALPGVGAAIAGGGLSGGMNQPGQGAGSGTPWGSGMPMGGQGSIGRSGHVVIFDSYRNNTASRGQ